MASDVMSLFGMNPDLIQQNRVQGGVDQASRMSADYAIGAAGGQMLGAGINSAFGLQTPDMAQAASVQSGLEGADLNTAAGLRNAAQQLMMSGDYAQAMALHAQARGMEEDETTATNLKQDRSLGKSSNVIVKQSIAPDPKNPLGVATPAVQHSIIKHVNGRVVDVTQGREFATEAEWIASIAERYGPEAAKALAKKDKEGDTTMAHDLSSGGATTSAEATQFDLDALQEQISITENPEQRAALEAEVANIVAGDPRAKKAAIDEVKQEAINIFEYLRAKPRQSGDRTERAKELAMIKTRLRDMGVPENEIEQLSYSKDKETVGP